MFASVVFGKCCNTKAASPSGFDPLNTLCHKSVGPMMGNLADLYGRRATGLLTQAEGVHGVL